MEGSAILVKKVLDRAGAAHVGVMGVEQVVKAEGRIQSLHDVFAEQGKVGHAEGISITGFPA